MISSKCCSPVRTTVRSAGSVGVLGVVEDDFGAVGVDALRGLLF
jgi:hypothetical protein